MVKRLAPLLLLPSLLLALAAGPCLAQKDVLLIVGQDSITVGEFRYAFEKNRAFSPEAQLMSVREFLDSYVNFRLKVSEAKHLRLDTSERFQREYRNYRDYQLAPYLIDSSEYEALYRESYARMQYELDASHILLSVPQAGDETTVYQRALQLKSQLEAGVPFDSLARIHSDDPSARENGGRLGFFGAFRMVYPFETAAYQVPVGGISDPVRTKFGYHLIKVHARRPTRPAMRVAHIMKFLPQNAGQTEIEAARNRLEEIRIELEKGADFAQLAATESQDRGSMDRGGELPPVASGIFPEEFVSACYELTRDGQISAPVRTSFGYHLIKRIEVQPIPTYPEARAGIIAQLQRIGAQLDGREAMLRTLRKRYAQELDRDVLALIAQGLLSADSTSQAVNLPSSLLDRPFATVQGRGISSRILVGAMLQEDPVPSHWIPDRVEQRATVLADGISFFLATEDLAQEKPEVIYLLEEFYNGLLLFDISERRLWNPSPEREKAMREIYQSHRGEYRFDYRVSVHELGSPDSATLAGIAPKLCRRRSRRVRLHDSLQARVRVRQMNYEADSPQLEGFVTRPAQKFGAVSSTGWQENCSPIMPKSDGFVFYHVFKEKAGVAKTYEEARAEVQAVYEHEAEKEWLARLRREYPVIIDQARVQSLEEAYNQ